MKPSQDNPTRQKATGGMAQNHVLFSSHTPCTEHLLGVPNIALVHIPPLRSDSLQGFPALRVPAIPHTWTAEPLVTPGGQLLQSKIRPLWLSPQGVFEETLEGDPEARGKGFGFKMPLA